MNYFQECVLAGEWKVRAAVTSSRGRPGQPAAGRLVSTLEGGYALAGLASAAAAHVRAIIED